MVAHKAKKYYHDYKLEELSRVLLELYEDGCSEDDGFNNLKRFIESKNIDQLNEKLMTIFHYIFFGDFEVAEKYNTHFLSLLNKKSDTIQKVIDEIFLKYNYGNHRKYCKKSYDYYEKAVNSFLGILQQIENDIQNDVTFDRLYNKIICLYSFGRTATWDFLECVDRIIVDGGLHPTKMYLQNATGPKNGVFYFFGVENVSQLKYKFSDDCLNEYTDGEVLEKAGAQIFNIIKNSDIPDKIKRDKFLIYRVEDALCIFQK